MKNLKIAIVYDWVDKWGGVERVLLMLAEMFPKADFYTSYYDPQQASWAKNLNLKTSFIQKLSKFIRKNRLLSFPFYPYAFESFNFSSYDLVISVSSSFAKGIITKPETLHVCYLLTPTRYLWVDTESYLDTPLKKALGVRLLKKFKNWDYIAAQRPDYIISISKTVKERVEKYYKRESVVIYPPFDVEYWQKIKSKVKSQSRSHQKFFLVVSRLEPYKKIDLVIDVFSKLTDQLIIVGKGTLLNKLKKQASDNIVFLSDLTDEALAWLYQNAQALIMPQEEEFGLVSLEAQFFGCPVIAFEKGGARETVTNNQTGMFFNKQSPRSLADAIERFKHIAYNLRTNTEKLGPENVKRFEKRKFIKKFMLHVSRFKIYKS